MSGREFIRMSGRELDYHYANYQIEKRKKKLNLRIVACGRTFFEVLLA